MQEEVVGNKKMINGLLYDTGVDAIGERPLDFTKLNRLLQTKAARTQTNEIDEKQQKMSKSKYWQTKVNSKETAFEYFQIYCPEYPKTLQLALADHFAAQAEKLANGEEIDEKYLLREQDNEEGLWDVQEELAKHGVKY